jgi:hypothetical protein
MNRPYLWNLWLLLFIPLLLRAETAALPLAPSAFAQVAGQRWESCMIIPFSEERRYQLKPRIFNFEGCMRYHPEKGLSIAYTQPTAKVFVLSPQGNLIIREPGQEDRHAPEEAAEGITVIQDLLRLDPERIRLHFNVVEDRVGPSDWQLSLSPIRSELRRFFQFIEVIGSEAHVTEVQIHNGRDRWRKMHFPTPPAPWDPEPQDIEAYF